MTSLYKEAAMANTNIVQLTAQTDSAYIFADGINFEMQRCNVK